MKSVKIAFIVCILAVIFVSFGLVSALNQNEASLQTVWLNQNIRPGDTVSVIVTFSSNSSDQLSISRIGFHFDWMGPNEFYANDFSTNPVVVVGGSSKIFDPMSVQIPPYVTSGSHSYYVAVDGVQGTSATSFFWDSPTFTITIAGGGSAPTPTPTASSGSGGQGDGLGLLPIIAVAAVVVVVVLLVVVMFMRRRRRRVEPKAETSAKSSVEPSDSSEFSI